MTLNQVIQKVQSLAKSHKQIRTVAFGDVVELVANTGIHYPACNVDINSGSMDWASKQAFVTVQIYLLDLINVAENTRGNEIEVLSDLFSIGQDLYALISDYAIQDDWTIDKQSSVQFMREKFDDEVGAVMFTLNISTDYLKDVCQVPKN